MIWHCLSQSVCEKIFNCRLSGVKMNCDAFDKLNLLLKSLEILFQGSAKCFSLIFELIFWKHGEIFRISKSFQISKRCQNIIGNICTKSFNQKWLKILDILPTSVGNVFVLVENLSKIIPNEWKRHLRSKCAPLLCVVTWARSRSIEVNHYVHCTYLNIHGGL